MLMHKMWMEKPQRKKSSNLGFSEFEKADVKQKVDEFIESHLKPKLIQPQPEKHPLHLNYVVDVFSKFHGKYFYIYLKYACTHPDAISPFFEEGLARLDRVSTDRYHLSYMRHTGKWTLFRESLSLDECFHEILDSHVFR